MFLGIDVGGTYTDAIVVGAGGVMAQTKTPTTHRHLLDGILNALDQILTKIDAGQIERIALSTTVVTNAVVEGNIDRVGLVVIPGPGADLSSKFPVVPHVVAGYVDHRGREVAPPALEQIEKACSALKECRVYAVSGKFSVRNPSHELKVEAWISKFARPDHISVSSRVSGTLNFWRRTNSAYYNAAVWRKYNEFADAVKEAFKQRGLYKPVFVLKADGGTLPLELSREQPIESIFTGPAASVLGVMAMNRFNCPAVSLDIGGTTTDIALWENGIPQFTSRGAAINGHPTAVRAFRLKSVGVGGDSYVRRDNGRLKVGPMRLGPAMALGGTVPTVSDAMIVLGIKHFGSKELAMDAMRRIALPGQTLEEAAQAVIKTSAEIISTAVREMIDEQAAEPVYRVEDIVYGRKFTPELVIGVGGAAEGLVPETAAMLGVGYIIPAGSMVANAVGAALARPTIDITLRADTAQGRLSVPELGITEKIDRSFNLRQAEHIAGGYLKTRAEQGGIEFSEAETIQLEEFNVVRGFNTVGKIITCRMQVKPGVLKYVDNIVREGELA